jgi:HAD superfamily hydrolase (TIGR01490 family)
MILAVFDVDDTLTRGDSLIWFGWYVLKRGGLKTFCLPALALCSMKYLFGLCNAGEFKAAVLKTLLLGTSVSAAEHLAGRFASELLLGKRFEIGTERIRWHKERKHRIVLLSASPEIYLQKFASLIGADTLICTRLIARDGYLTGELAGENCKGDEKLKRLSSEATLRDADWRASYGYGNSAEDIPFLKALGTPTAVNPDRKLKQMALQLGWKIENWRS